jgi:Flp pilus assembly pilin Flp
MKKLMVRFLREEQGQDLIEYTLLLAFVCLAAAAIFIPEGQQLSAIWTATNTVTNAAAGAAGNAVAAS